MNAFGSESASERCSSFCSSPGIWDFPWDCIRRTGWKGRWSPKKYGPGRRPLTIPKERIGPNEYVLTSVSFVFGYDPKEVTVPAGAKVHFRVTSRDVIHGFYIPGTTVNMMVEPGHITEQTYTFDKPGKYLVLCHEYCGSGHHLMQGTIYVKGE